MLPHIFEVGLKVNPKVYLDVLKSVVIPWCNQVAGGRPWVWKQDSAPTHKSKETQGWLQKKCYDFVPFSHWPPSSPDLNPLDYFVWSYVENTTNMTSYNTKASLIAVAGNFVFITLCTFNRLDLHFEGAGNGPVAINWIGRGHVLYSGASPILLVEHCVTFIHNRKLLSLLGFVHNWPTSRWSATKKENWFSLNGNGIMSSFLGRQFYRSPLYIYIYIYIYMCVCVFVCIYI